MMKKNALTLLSLCGAFSLFSLGGCSKSNYSGKVFLDYGYIRENKISNITELQDLTYNKLKSKLSTEESFMLVLFNHSCTCWGIFQPVITQYINDTNVKVEYIDVDEFTGESDVFGLFLEKINMPSVALFRRGKLVRQAYTSRDPSSEMFEDYTKFKQWADENVVLPKMYYVEKNVLDSYIADNMEFNLYIARGECGDCQTITYDVLYDYSDNNAELKKPLYIFDIQPYCDTDLYQPIKDQYGLTTVNNPTFGYDLWGGVVPTFQHRKGNEIKDMISVLNDMPVDGKVSSYFTEERVSHMNFLKNSSLTAVLDGMELSEQQVADWWKSVDSSRKVFYKEYHYPITALFLDTYLK